MVSIYSPVGWYPCLWTDSFLSQKPWDTVLGKLSGKEYLLLKSVPKWPEAGVTKLKSYKMKIGEKLSWYSPYGNLSSDS